MKRTRILLLDDYLEETKRKLRESGLILQEICTDPYPRYIVESKWDLWESGEVELCTNPFSILDIDKILDSWLPQMIETGEQFDLVLIDDHWGVGDKDQSGQDKLFPFLFEHMSDTTLCLFTRHYTNDDRMKNFAKNILMNPLYRYSGRVLLPVGKDDKTAIKNIFNFAASVNKRMIKYEEQIDSLVSEFLKKDGTFFDMIGYSKPMQNVYNQICRFANSNSNVLIIGESGTGKGLVARAIHKLSSRKSEPFIQIIIAALKESLIESELFGHVKGAFTDAKDDKTGYIERANGGTFFIDEIGELKIDLQVKLLEVIQDQTFAKVGSTDPLKVDVRFIAATNKNLEEEISKGTFRLDLFYRLNVLRINLPSLRDRKDDIPLLMDYLTKKIAEKVKKNIPCFSPSAIKKMISHQWPGNIRELENWIESAITMSNGKQIELAHLPEHVIDQINESENVNSGHPNGSLKGLFSSENLSKAKYYLDVYDDACVKLHDNSKITQKMIANKLGTSRESVNQILGVYGKEMLAWFKERPKAWPTLLKKTNIISWCHRDK